MASLQKIVAHCDKILRIREIADWDNALNGLQIENSGRVIRFGAAVDASTRALNLAAERGVDFLVVHHGLYWQGLQPVTGILRKQLNIAFKNDLAVYSAHLPLDVHPSLGNNALLAGSLGLGSAKPFLEEKGVMVGVKSRTSRKREELLAQLRKSLGTEVRAFNFGPAKTRMIGIVTGAGGSEIHRVAAEGIDTFITGEAPHWAAVAAEELGVNLWLGGHYATETFGVKALAKHLSKKFKLPFEFIDCPTGL
ncbi:MAG TPA: Nif3-like dinuclear metal center hexameric protein [Chthoniobacterales bacterium]|nr:Nif3-like dinuclear metal center hexameric protein [Chthoniobacterales bacterium]